LAEARKRRDQQPFLAEGGPVALGILDQLVELRDPERAAAALQPVVEDDAGHLTPFAGAGAIAEKPAATEAHGALDIVGGSGDLVVGRIHQPGACEMPGMGFARVDDALDLRVR
jgi:hypothetical protein